MSCFFPFHINYLPSYLILAATLTASKEVLQIFSSQQFPLVLILVINVTLYLLTWLRIKREEPRFKDISGKEAKVIRSSHRAARTMSLFVAAFLIQWWAMAVYGIVQLVTETPIELFRLVTTFSNIGGILNAIVFILIRRKSNQRNESSGSVKSKPSSGTETLSRFQDLDPKATVATEELSTKL